MQYNLDAAVRHANEFWSIPCSDGLVWTKVPGPNIEQSDHPISKTSWDCALLYRDGQLEYFLEIGYETTNVYRGTLPWP